MPEEKESLEMLRSASKLWKRYLSEYNIQILNGNFSTQELTDDIISRVLNVLKKLYNIRDRGEQNEKCNYGNRQYGKMENCQRYF